MFLSVKGYQSYRRVNIRTFMAPIYELKIIVQFGFFFVDKSSFGMSQAIQKCMKLTKHPNFRQKFGESGVILLLCTHLRLPPTAYVERTADD